VSSFNDLDTPFSNLEVANVFDAFDAGSDPVVEVVRPRPSSVMPRIVHTPTGDEIVPMEVFEEQTQVYNKRELELLLTAANVNRHLTVPCMAAVEPR
jgi:hypothetical protein